MAVQSVHATPSVRDLSAARTASDLTIERTGSTREGGPLTSPGLTPGTGTASFGRRHSARRLSLASNNSGANFSSADRRRSLHSNSSLGRDDDDARASGSAQASLNGSASGPSHRRGVVEFKAFHDDGDHDLADVVSVGADTPPFRSPQPPGSHASSRRSTGVAVDADDGQPDEAFESPDEIPSSLFIFSGTNPLRLACLTVIQNFWFHQFILACIILNSITLAMDQPAVENPAELQAFLDGSEIFFTVVFCLEMVLKVIALGFALHPHAYLRTPWNVLDGIIVIASVVNLFVSGGNVSALRVVRVLRPLRSVSRIKNLRLLIAGLFQAMPEVVNNLLLFGFITLVFAIAAVQLWSARLSQRCYITALDDNVVGFDPMYANVTVPMLLQNDRRPCGGNHECVASYGPASAVSCEIHRDLYTKRNLNYDNFFAAALLVFKVMVFDNWPDDLDDAMNAIGPTAVIFFIILTLIGGYVCVNLFLAVLTQGYSKAARDLAEDAEIETDERGTQTEFLNIDKLDEEEALELAADMGRRRRRRKEELRKLKKSFRKQFGGSQGSTGGSTISPTSSPSASVHMSGRDPGSSSFQTLITPTSRNNTTGNAGGDYNFGTPVIEQEQELQNMSPEDAKDDGPPRRRRLPSDVAAAAEDGSMRSTVAHGSVRQANGEGQISNSTIPTAIGDAKSQDSRKKHSSVVFEGATVVDEPAYFNDENEDGMPHSDDELESDTFELDTEDSSFRRNDDRNWIRKFLGRIISHKYTEVFMMIVTLLNVVVLAIDHYGIDPETDNTLNIISIVCTAIFGVEIATKLFAFGPRCLKNGFTALDFVLIVVSIITMSISGGEGSGFSAFRALRVFRIFRLLSKFESLQTVLEGILQSVASIGYLSFLIFLFLYVYSILGMQVFGTDYASSMPDVRDSFGTIWQSAITAFIVVTGDNWTDKMQVGMASYSNGLEVIPVVYFVSLYMIGNFILINLSVAIIVDKLQEKMEAHDEKVANAGEALPPVLLIAPYQIGLMAYRDRIRDEYDAAMKANDTDVLNQTRFRNMRRSSTAGSLPMDVDDDLADGPRKAPSFVEVISPLTDEQRSHVEHALREANHNGGAGVRNSRRASISSVASHRRKSLGASTTGDLGKDTGAPFSAPASSPTTQRQLGGTLQMRPDGTMAFHRTSDDDDENDDGEPNGAKEIPLTQARYVDHLRTSQSSCGVQAKLLGLWFRSFFVSRPPVVTQNALRCLSPTNPLRRGCLWIVGMPAYSFFIMFVTFLNVVSLTLDGPDASPVVSDAILFSDYVFAGVFVLEMMIKIVALGAFTPGESESLENIQQDRRPAVAYFRDTWNVIDFFVIVVSLIGLFVPVLKALRALRTIRLVARIETTRIIMVALMQAVPHVLHGLALSLVVFLVFGILGVQLFKGQLYSCNDPATDLKSDCIGQYNATKPGAVFSEPILVDRDWVRTTYHFDNLGAALMTLFVVSISDGWSEIMFNGMDIVDENHSLKRDSSPWMSLYFITVFIACNFFAINMMIGILINYFSKKKKVQDGSALLTDKQRLYFKARDVISASIVGEDDITVLPNPVSQFLHSVMTYCHPMVQRVSVFDAVMLVFIIVNVVAVATEHDGMDPSTARTLDTIQLVCLIVFTLEMVLKWVAYGPYYFTTNWNRFDFIIVVLGWVSYGLPAVSFLAFLRVFRVIKLIRGTGVERLIFVLIRSFTSLLHVVTILILTYFIFAVAGVALFGDIRYNKSITENNNFRTVWNGMLVLYQCATTENWNGVMESVSVQPPACSEEAGDCGQPEIATTYFILFMVCCTFTALQLFVAVIVEIFDDDVAEDDPLKHAFVEVRELWIERFGENCPTVHYTELILLIPEFPPILTDFEDDEISRADMVRFLATLPIPIDSKHHIKYSDLVHALAFKKYQVDPRTMGSVIQDAMAAMFIGAAFSISQIYALEVIAGLWKEYRGGSIKETLASNLGKHKASTSDHVHDDAAADADAFMVGSRNRGVTSPTDPNALRAESVNTDSVLNPCQGPSRAVTPLAASRHRDSVAGVNMSFEGALPMLDIRPSTAAIQISVDPPAAMHGTASGTRADRTGTATAEADEVDLEVDGVTRRC
jgi:hypothetical protein